MVLIGVVIGMHRGGAIAALPPASQQIQDLPEWIGDVAISAPQIATGQEASFLEQISISTDRISTDRISTFPTLTDAPTTPTPPTASRVTDSSVTELRLQGHNRQALGMVLRSLGVPEARIGTLQREDFPALALMAIRLEPPIEVNGFDRKTLPDRVARAAEDGLRLSEDQRPQLLELADIFQAIGERDLVEPLLRYLLVTSDRDGERATLYERLGRFHGAQAQWHEQYQDELTGTQYQAAIGAYEQAALLMQGDRDTVLRLQLAHLRTELAEQRHTIQQLYADTSAHPELVANLNALGERFHTVYREVMDTEETPSTIAMQLDLASQLACLHSLATPQTQTFGVSPTVLHCAAPNWPQSPPIAATILDDRRALLAHATEASTRLSEQLGEYQPSESLAAMITQRLRLQALLLSGDLAALDLTPAIAAQMLPTLEANLAMLESSGARDLGVQLLWQAGRIAIAVQQPQLARQYYAQAIADLEQLRIDLGSLATDWRYDFRDAIAPLYQDYLTLLLPRPEDTVTSDSDSVVSLAMPTPPKDLETAIATLQSLQLAELDDFFGEACAIPQRFKIAQLDQEEYRNTALLATVVLPDRTETIVTFLNDPAPPSATATPDSPARQWLRYSSPIPQSQLNVEVEQLLISLQMPRGLNLDKRTQTVYQHYFQEAIAALEQVTPPNTIKTILFIPDGGLRSIPLGAFRLPTGDYLIQHYDTAVIPSFDLIATDPEDQAALRLRTLAVGRSKFENTPASTRSTARLLTSQSPLNPDGLMSDLDHVESEILGIVNLLPDASYLLDETFLSDTFASTIASRRYDVAHIATHGSFGALAAQTYIVAQDGPIGFDRLGQLLRSNDPTRATDLDLVIFSACQTAEGSDRAVLGMAGMGLRAGVRSTIGSLWNVDDLSTSLIMQRFYRYRRDGLSKAAALSAAQRDAINKQLDPSNPNQNFSSPYYWSPFVLVGAW
jgi:CHAT domain-containing protein